MLRDFSESSKQSLLGLVSQVENEKWSDFTDWMGDRWYDFEDWIGSLNIRNYINDVNSYHKKVIDKNNATKESIERIFSEINSINGTYSGIFDDTENSLKVIQKYINNMNRIISPRNGRFDAEYIDAALKSIVLNEINGAVEEEQESFFKKKIKELEILFKILSGIAEAGSEYGNDEGASWASTVLSYLETLFGMVNADNKSGLDIVSGGLSLFKDSTKVETGLFDYFMKTLKAEEASKLDIKFGKGMGTLKIISSVTELVNKGIDNYKVVVDPDSNIYDKISKSIKTGGSALGLGGCVYMVQQAQTKTLQVVNKIETSSTAVNQILVTEQSTVYATSKEATKNIGKAKTVLAIGNVIVQTVADGFGRYGEVSADGNVDIVDGSSVVVHGCLGGLDAVASGLSLGILSFDSEKFADELENDIDTFINEDNWVTEYIRDTDNWAVLRFGVSVGSGAYLFGKKVVVGVGEKVKTIASWIPMVNLVQSFQ